MKILKYANNDEMPALGLGTWKSANDEVYNAVREAIKIGYRHIDCAHVYGNEAEIGQALTAAIEAGDVTREELWITSKLWNNSHRKEQVMPALHNTMNNLQLDYLDLYIIHWPVVVKDEVLFPENSDDMVSLSTTPIAETWESMELCHQLGLAKHIGVSNFSVSKLKELVASGAQPEMNQIELHPLLQQNNMLSYCREAGILLTGYSPLGSPDRLAQLKADDEPNLLKHPAIIDIASAHNVSSAQVLIQWAIARGTSVIPKSVDPGRLKQNFDAAQLELSVEDMEKIAAMDQHYRYVKGQFWAMEDSPYTVSNLWDE
jgi:alcohol dehydrogenase (NADP+)